MMIQVFLENDRTAVPRLYLNTDNTIRFFPTNLKDICPLWFLPTKNHIDLHQSSKGPVGFKSICSDGLWPPQVSVSLWVPSCLPSLSSQSSHLQVLEFYRKGNLGGDFASL